MTSLTYGRATYLLPKCFINVTKVLCVIITSLLFLSSKREEAKKRSILTNPVKMKEIRKMVSRLEALQNTPKGIANKTCHADLFVFLIVT